MIRIQINIIKMFPWNLFFLFFMLVAVDAQRSCYTPYNALGQCVDYKTCSYLSQQLEKFGSQIPQEFYEFVKKSRCPSANNRAIFVCCERRFIQQPTTPTVAPPTTAATVDGVVLELDNQPINERGLQILKDVPCGEISGNKVSFGEKTKLQEFTFMALLKYDTSEVFNCGGTLITNRFVITAAHCWVGKKNEPIGVRLGEYNYNNDKDCEKRGRMDFCNPPVEDYGIEKLIPHPLYTKKGQIHHDIGLIKLDRNVAYKDHIKAVCLPIFSYSQITDDRYLIAGWGSTEKNEENPKGFLSPVLLKAVIPHRSNDFCQSIFTKYKITENHLCAGGVNRVDSCKGDSGGPLFFQSLYDGIVRYVQFGIVSNGVASCGVNSYPTVYTKIKSYIPWITNTLAEES